jgi:hypothetical protein
LIAGGTDPSGWRLPAPALESTLCQIVVGHLRRTAAGHGLLSVPDARGANGLLDRATVFADRVASNSALFGSLIASGTLAPGHLHLLLDREVIAAGLEVATAALSDQLLVLTCPLALRRRGVETRIIAGETIPAPDQVLQRTLAEAHVWARALRSGTSLIDLARATGHSKPYIRARLPLAFLAPRVQAAILDGRQPAELSVSQIIREDLPMDWAEQARIFGIG